MRVILSRTTVWRQTFSTPSLCNGNKICKGVMILNNIRFHFVAGYAFLLFLEEISVQRLIEACIEQDQKLYLCVSSPTIKDKPVGHADAKKHSFK